MRSPTDARGRRFSLIPTGLARLDFGGRHVAPALPPLPLALRVIESLRSDG